MKLLTPIYTVLVCIASFGLSAESILIKNAKVHTQSEQGTLEDADILIDNGKIRMVGKGIGSDADRVIDAKGMQVTPGIFALNNSIGLVEIDALDQTADSYVDDEFNGVSFSPEEAFNPNSTLIPHNRANGVTRTLIAPAYGNHLLRGQASVMSLNGEYHPLIKKGVAVFGSYGETGSNIAGGSRATALKQLQLLLDEAREYSDNYEAILTGEYRELFTSIEDLKALQPLIKGEIPLVMNVHRAADIKALLRFASRNNLRLIINGAAEAWMVAKDIARANVPVLLDPMDNIPRSFEALGQRIDNASLLHKAGVTLLFQGPGFQNTHNGHTVRHSAGLAVAYGLPYDIALAAFTSTPATTFGLSNYGQIKPGFNAELVVWDGDPLEVTSVAEKVIIDGKVMSMVTKSKRLRDRYKNITTDKNTAFNK